MTNVHIAIDPGPTESAYVVMEGERPLEFAKGENSQVRHRLNAEFIQARGRPHLVVEMVASYGMPVGEEVFETVLWTGRFIELWHPLPFSKVKRAEVKMHLCHSMRAKDSNILQALYDRYGGNRRACVGTKKDPGPCYGFSGDMWQALAVGLTWWDTRGGVRD